MACRFIVTTFLASLLSIQHLSFFVLFLVSFVLYDFISYACVNTISFSNGDQSLLASSGDDERVLIWRMLDNPGGKHIREFKGHESNVFHAIFDKPNTHILSCGNDHLIKYYDLEASSTLPLCSFESHLAAVYRVSFCPSNDNIFLSASEDRKVYLWDQREGNKLCSTAVASSSAFRSVQWAPQGSFFVTSNKKCGVQLWDIRAAKVPRFIGTSNQQEPLVQYISRFRHASGAAFNSSGTQIIATIEKDGPAMYDLASRFPTCVFSDPQYINSCTIKGATFIGNYDEFIACGSDDFRVYIWKIPGHYEPTTPPNKSTIDNYDESPTKNKNDNNNNNNCDDSNNNNENNDNDNSANNNSYSQSNKTQKQAQSILLGHRSIVNNVAWNSSLGVLCTAGVEKMVKVWSTFSISESDTHPRVYRPRTRIPINFMGHLDDPSEGTVAESNSTLSLFDLFLQVEEENAGRKRANGGALLQRSSVAYGEDEVEIAGGRRGSVTYTFEVQDSESSDDESDESESEDEDEGLPGRRGRFAFASSESDEEDEEDEEAGEDGDDELMMYRSGPGWNFTFVPQDSDSENEKESESESESESQSQDVEEKGETTKHNTKKRNARGKEDKGEGVNKESDDKKKQSDDKKQSDQEKPPKRRK